MEVARATKKHRFSAMLRCHITGADDEARTRYLHLGKVALYQMSYIRIYVNPRERDFMERMTRLELAITPHKTGFAGAPTSIE